MTIDLLEFEKPPKETKLMNRYKDFYGYYENPFYRHRHYYGSSGNYNGNNMTTDLIEVEKNLRELVQEQPEEKRNQKTQKSKSTKKLKIEEKKAKIDEKRCCSMKPGHRMPRCKSIEFKLMKVAQQLFLHNAIKEYSYLLSSERKREGLNKAKKYYEKSFQIRKELQQETGTVRSYKDLLISYDKFDSIYKKIYEVSIEKWNKKTRKAEERKEKAYENHKKIAHESYKKSYYKVREKLEEIYVEGKEVSKCYEEERRKRIEEALEINGIIVKETGTVEDYYNWGIMCIKMGNDFSEHGTRYVHNIAKVSGGYYIEPKKSEISAMKKNYEKARNYYESAVRAFEYLVKETEIVEHRRVLSDVYIELAAIIRAEQYVVEKREKLYQLIQEIPHYGDYDALVELIYRVRNSSNLVSCFRNMEKACLYVLNDNLEEREYYKKSLKICEELVQETEAVEDYEELAHICYMLGKLNNEESKVFLERARDIWVKLYNEYPYKQHYNENINRMDKSYLDEIYLKTIERVSKEYGEREIIERTMASGAYDYKVCEYLVVDFTHYFYRLIRDYW